MDNDKPRGTAIRAALLRRKLDQAREAEEAAVRAVQAYQTREAELAAAIEAASTPEEVDALEADVNRCEEEKTAAETAAAEKRAAVEELERQLREAENKANQLRAAPPPDSAPGMARQRGGSDVTITANDPAASVRREVVERMFRGISAPDRMAIVQRDDVRNLLDRVRTALGGETRAITNVGLTIPDVLLGIIQANVEGYSKLLKHVRVFDVQGDTRQIISSVPVEAVWTECCANINALSHAFYQEEFTCHKVAGYFAVCNANREDSALDLTALLMSAMSEGLGLALDKSILYGRNATTTLKMPMGVMSRLVQMSQPDDYPSTARPWVDLHTSNLISIASSVHGVDLFRALVEASGAAWSPYSSGEMTWYMRKKTYTKLLAEAMSFNSNGAVVSGFGQSMPVIGGTVDTLEFIPDNVIIGGYFNAYSLIRLAGIRFAMSEHVFFLEDNTVFKGTGRFDGGPVIPEAFVAINIAGGTPNATMSFAADTANVVEEPSGGGGGTG